MSAATLAAQAKSETSRFIRWLDSLTLALLGPHPATIPQATAPTGGATPVAPKPQQPLVNVSGIGAALASPGGGDGLPISPPITTGRPLTGTIAVIAGLGSGVKAPGVVSAAKPRPGQNPIATPHIQPIPFDPSAPEYQSPTGPNVVNNAALGPINQIPIVGGIISGGLNSLGGDVLGLVGAGGNAAGLTVAQLNYVASVKGQTNKTEALAAEEGRDASKDLSTNPNDAAIRVGGPNGAPTTATAAAVASQRADGQIHIDPSEP